MASAFTLTAEGSPPHRAADVDAAEVRQAVQLLADPSAGVEVRALPSARTRVLAGSDAAGVVRWVERCAGDRGIYYTLNPVPPTLGRHAADADVLRRRWLLVDVDPAKPDAAKDASATDAEKQAARGLAVRAQEWLSEGGWPMPVVVDSGNGFHLLYRVDLANDPAAHTLVKAALVRLAARFDGPDGKIDRSVHNAARIAKLPGTTARKGEPTADRPHRPCRVVYAPGEPRPVPAELLQLVARGEEAGAARTPPTAAFPVRATDTRSEAYARSALERESGRVVLAPAGGRNNALNRAAFSLGQLVAGGVLPRHEVEGALFFAACRAGLDADPDCGQRGIDATIKSGLDAGAETPRGVPAAAGNGRKADAGPKKGDAGGVWSVTLDGQEIVRQELTGEFAGAASDPRHRLVEVFTLGGLMRAEFAPPNWVVAGILSEGLNILAGKPKTGKSMLALNLAITVAAGGRALKSIATTPGDVLYLSLEDKHRRVQARARRMLGGLDVAVSDRLQIATNWPQQETGGLQLIEMWARRAERPVLVIVDVWGKFRPAHRQGPIYEQDYRHLSDVKRLVDGLGFSALVLHHCRKGGSEDAVEEVSGTMGLTGVADGIMVLTRSRNDNEAKVYVTGRDFGETELALRFDPAALTWSSLGSAEEYMQGKLQAAVLNYLKGLAGVAAFCSDIAAAVNEEPDKVRPTLHRLFAKRLIRKEGKAWAYPGEGDDGDAVEF